MHTWGVGVGEYNMRRRKEHHRGWGHRAPSRGG